LHEGERGDPGGGEAILLKEASNKKSDNQTCSLALSNGGFDFHEKSCSTLTEENFEPLSHAEQALNDEWD